MNDIHKVSANLKFILYADDTTITSPLCSFTHGGNDDISLIEALINLELCKISDWLAVNKLSLNVQKTKFMIFHNYQRVISANEIPNLIICETNIERVTTFNFLGITINEYINWNAHTSKIANKISHTLGVMNRLKRYLPISVMKLMYDSLILSHLQFGITCWGFECNRLFKLQKRALRIMTNSKYNAHTEPIFKDLKLLKLDGIFDIQCMKFFYKFTNNTLPKYFHYLSKYNREIYEIVTRNYNQLHLFPTRTNSAENVLRHHIPKLIDKFPRHIKDRIRTHSIHAFSSHLKPTLLILIVLFVLIHSATFVTTKTMYNYKSLS